MKKVFRLRIEKLALGGFGIGYHEGKAVFVPYTAVGDEVEAALLHERTSMAFARAQAYFIRGAGVIPPDCEAFAAKIPCGGCDWLHLDYPVQLQSKTELLRELLHPLAPDLAIPETLAAPQPLEYRNKAFLPVGSDAGGLYCGIFARWSHRIVTHRHCQLHPPLLEAITRRCLEILSKTGVQAYDEVRHAGTLRHIGYRCTQDLSGIQIILVTRSGKLPFTRLLVKQLTEEFPAIVSIVQNINRERGNVILGVEDKVLFGEPWLQEDLAGLKFRIHYRSFWQINTPMLSLILGQIKALLKPEDVVFDAFAGIGTLGLALSSEVRKVLCIEENPDAVTDGEFNARRNDLANVSFLRAKTEDALPALLAPGITGPQELPTVLLLDPPRGGVRPEALHAIIQARLPRIVYLSCSPATLHRDLKILLGSGLYRLTKIQPCDMFPQTWHVETLAVLDLIDTATAE